MCVMCAASCVFPVLEVRIKSSEQRPGEGGRRARQIIESGVAWGGKTGTQHATLPSAGRTHVLTPIISIIYNSTILYLFNKTALATL